MSARVRSSFRLQVVRVHGQDLPGHLHDAAKFTGLLQNLRERNARKQVILAQLDGLFELDARLLDIAFGEMSAAQVEAQHRIVGHPADYALQVVDGGLQLIALPDSIISDARMAMASSSFGSSFRISFRTLVASSFSCSAGSALR